MGENSAQNSLNITKYFVIFLLEFYVTISCKYGEYRSTFLGNCVECPRKLTQCTREGIDSNICNASCAPLFTMAKRKSTLKMPTKNPASLFTTVKDKSTWQMATKNPAPLFTTVKDKSTLEMPTTENSVISAAPPITKRTTWLWKTFTSQLTSISSSSEHDGSAIYRSKYERIANAFKVGGLLIIATALVSSILGIGIAIKNSKNGAMSSPQNSTRTEDNNDFNLRDEENDDRAEFLVYSYDNLDSIDNTTV